MEKKGKKAMAEHVKKDELHEEKKDTLFCMPKNVRQIGQPDGNRKIYIEDYVMSFIRYLGKESTDTYRTAVFLGEYKEWEDSQCIFIQGAIEVEGIDLKEGKCFPKEIWEKIYQEIEENFKTGSIVGWMLTKAGMPIEVTDTLEKIHIDNFSGQDKTLMLYDTIEREECFYLFEKKHLKKKEGYYIYYEKNQEMQNYMLKKKGTMPSEQVDDYVIKEMKKRMGTMEEIKKKKSRARKRWRVATMVAAVLLLGVLWQNRAIINDWRQTAETLSENKNLENNQDDELLVEQQQSKITLSKEEAKKQQETPEAKETKQEEENRETTNPEGEQSTEPVETPQGQAEDNGDTQEVLQTDNIEEEGQYYTIQPGDTLVSICMKQFQSLEKMEDILEINHIEDKDKIVAGQKIKLWE